MINNNGIYEKVYADKNEMVIEIVGIDKNEDNNFEIILFDTNNNGNPDEAEIDEDEDGITDVIAYDYNEDESGTSSRTHKIYLIDCNLYFLLY